MQRNCCLKLYIVKKTQLKNDWCHYEMLIIGMFLKYANKESDETVTKYETHTCVFSAQTS